MGAVHGLNAVLVVALANHVIRPAGRWERIGLRVAAAVLGVTGIGFVSLLGVTTNDLLGSILVLAGLLAVLQLAERVDVGWRAFILPGAIAGAALGLKFTAALFVPGFAVLAAWVAVKRSNPAGVFAYGAGAAAAFLAVAGYHLATLWVDFGNPLFPWLNNVFRSPYFDQDAMRDSRFVPHGVQLVTFPFEWMKTNSYLVTELAFRDWRAAIAIVMTVVGGVAALATGGFRRRAESAAVGTCGLRMIVVFVGVSSLLG